MSEPKRALVELVAVEPARPCGRLPRSDDPACIGIAVPLALWAVLGDARGAPGAVYGELERVGRVADSAGADIEYRDRIAYARFRPRSHHGAAWRQDFRNAGEWLPSGSLLDVRSTRVDRTGRSARHTAAPRPGCRVATDRRHRCQAERGGRRRDGPQCRCSSVHSHAFRGVSRARDRARERLAGRPGARAPPLPLGWGATSRHAGRVVERRRRRCTSRRIEPRRPRSTL
jgi:hypothetical protein